MQHFAENLCLASPPAHKQHIDYYIIVFFEKRYKVGYSLVFTGNLQSAATLDVYVSAFAPLESMKNLSDRKNGKLALLTSGRPAFQQHVKRAEGSDTTPTSHVQKVLRTE